MIFECCFGENVFLSEQVIWSFNKSDQDCGAGGGRNNAEVFYVAGYTVFTDENVDDSQQDGD